MPDFEDEYDAMSVLRQNFREYHNGMLCPRVAGYTPTELEVDAINYLIGEWDFSYTPRVHVG